jgi:hypothetical protein
MYFVLHEESELILSRVGDVCDLQTGFGLDDWIYWHLITPLGTTGNYSAIAIPTLYRSLPHTSVPRLLHSPLVVSWHGLDNSLTVISNHTWSLLCAARFVLLPLFSIAVDWRLSQFCCTLPTPERNSILILAVWDPCYVTSWWTHRKHLSLSCMLIHCCREVFTASCITTTSARTHRKRCSQHFLYCCVMSQWTWRILLLCVYGPLPSTVVLSGAENIWSTGIGRADIP